MNALFVAWRSGGDGDGAWGPVGRLDFDGQIYRFCYTFGSKTLKGFRPFPKMESLETVYESAELFPLFANRLLSESRPEYEQFLRWGGFDPDNPPPPIVVLGLTEGLRQTDSIEVFPCPTHAADGCYLNRFFLHGIRHAPAGAIERINHLQPGDQLGIAPEPTNPADSNAIAVFTSEPIQRIGYVPRYLAHDAWHLLEHCGDYVELFVDQANPDAPLQQRLLCRMRACWPGDFQPCATEAFQPIPSGVPAHCEA
ncbi:MAG: HIRAN domain-containing protein [Gemmataceae bacterium]